MDGDQGACIALVGRSGAGKSTLAQALNRKLGWPVVGFGNAVRARGSASGVAASGRRELVELGAAWVRSDPEGLVREVMRPAEKSASVVVDGVRHSTILALLANAQPPRHLLVVHLATDEATFVLRAQRAGSTVEEALWLWGSSAESDVDGPLLEAAHLRLTASGSTTDHVLAVVASLVGQGSWTAAEGYPYGLHGM